MVTSLVTESELVCPYCGENNDLSLEIIDEPQSFFQDCQVCCRPMRIEIGALEPGGGFRLEGYSESD